MAYVQLSSLTFPTPSTIRHSGASRPPWPPFARRNPVQGLFPACPAFASWKKRDGAGAFFTIARPWDRFESISKTAGYDLFAKIGEEGLEGQDGTLIACVRDLRRYLMLVEAEMTERLTAPEKKSA